MRYEVPVKKLFVIRSIVKLDALYISNYVHQIFQFVVLYFTCKALKSVACSGLE